MKRVDIWKLFGVIPFFSSAFMSIFSIGLLTAVRLISVQNALPYNTIMTKFKANILTILSWVATAAIISSQKIIYLCISPETELIARSYLVATFVFIGGMYLLTANTKLFLIISSKLRRTSTLKSVKMKTGNNSEGRNEEQLKRKTGIRTTGLVKVKAQCNLKQYDEHPTTPCDSKEKSRKAATMTRPLEMTISVEVENEYTFEPDGYERQTMSTGTKTSLKVTAQRCSKGKRKYPCKANNNFSENEI